jgi:chaperone required for assembly of F1-ATPase
MHVAQPPEALAAIGAALEAYDDAVELAALSVMTTLTGSAVLALAVAKGFLSPETAWRAAHVDEDFQAERWGADAEAVARRDARCREFEAAATTVALTCKNGP